jgi:hypothetical protein
MTDFEKSCSRCDDAASYQLFRTNKKDVHGEPFCENHALMAIEDGEYSEEPTEELFAEGYEDL